MQSLNKHASENELHAQSCARASTGPSVASSCAAPSLPNAATADSVRSSLCWGRGRGRRWKVAGSDAAASPFDDRALTRREMGVLGAEAVDVLHPQAAAGGRRQCRVHGAAVGQWQGGHIGVGGGQTPGVRLDPLTGRRSVLARGEGGRTPLEQDGRGDREPSCDPQELRRGWIPCRLGERFASRASPSARRTRTVARGPSRRTS